MPIWNPSYYGGLANKFREITTGLKYRLKSIVNGRSTPSIDDSLIGSAKQLNCAVLFFDIQGSSSRSGYVALYTLDTVIPMVMKVVHDHGGYIEKNTGDGVMAIFPGMDEKVACKAALESAMNCFCVLHSLINPHLAEHSIPSVNARIGIEFGDLLIARIGVHQGSARQDRNFLTAIGHAANIACRLQEQAGINEIWAGEALRRLAPQEWQYAFRGVTPRDWTWTYSGTTTSYPAWHFDMQRSVPSSQPPALPRPAFHPLPDQGLVNSIRPPSLPTSGLLNSAGILSQPPSIPADGLLNMKPPTLSPSSNGLLGLTPETLPQSPPASPARSLLDMTPEGVPSPPPAPDVPTPESAVISALLENNKKK